MDATNANTALASAFAEELARCGVELAVICPGSRSTPIALALVRNPGIRAVPIVDERSAAFFALGAAAASGRPVALSCTSGTAAANFHPAVCEAHESDVPLIVLTSDRPPELRDVGAGQTIDQLHLYGRSVRWFCEVGTHAADDAGLLHMRAVACRAFAAATGDERPGPVHLNLSWREPLGPEPRPQDVTATARLALEGRDEAPLTRVARHRAEPDAGTVAELAEGADGRRVLLVAGRQGDPALGPALARLAAATGWPLLAEPTSQARFGPTAPHAIWTYDHIARSRPRELEPELVLRFGELPTSKALRTWLAALDGCEQVAVAPYGWAEPTRRAEQIVRADPARFADALGDRVAAAADKPDWGRSWRAAHDAVAAALRQGIAALGEPSEPGVAQALGGLLSDGELVFAASSMPVRDLEAFLPAGEAEALFLANRGANGIDGTVAAAAGACAATGRPAWLVCGDLALHHDANGLAALRHCESPLTILVLNNDGGGIFELLPQAEQVAREEFEAVFGTPLGLDLEALARAHGIEHRLVADLAELSALPRERHLLAEVRTERRRNAELHRELAARAADALAQALGRG